MMQAINLVFLAIYRQDIHLDCHEAGVLDSGFPVTADEAQALDSIRAQKNRT
jgi:hypothetical protein